MLAATVRLSSTSVPANVTSDERTGWMVDDPASVSTPLSAEPERLQLEVPSGGEFCRRPRLSVDPSPTRELMPARDASEVIVERGAPEESIEPP